MDDLGEYKERINSYTLLTGKCTVCKSPNVVIRINSYRQYKNKRVVSGNQSHDYCVEHSPINIEVERKSWLQTLITPP